jgi:capsule polysaccharide export protein KpsE/RkpR
MRSIFLIAEGEELLVRTVMDELLRIQAKLKELQSIFEEKNQYLTKLELDILNLKSQIRKN